MILNFMAAGNREAAISAYQNQELRFWCYPVNEKLFTDGYDTGGLTCDGEGG